MPEFLCFRLHGPLASWGDIAIGERRPSAPNVSRSAVLGLLAGALGLRRDDADGLSELDRSMGFACRTDAPGSLVVDYHTAQGPDEALLRAVQRESKRQGKGWTRPATRREELAFRRPQLSTLLSRREYRADAVWTTALWIRVDECRWSIGQLVDALRRPRFLPYLGRKSCPLDVPMEPQIVEAANPVDAMARAVFRAEIVLDPVLRSGRGKATVQWEGQWRGLQPTQTVRRRDRVLSRSRWQFTYRDEQQDQWLATEEKSDVPEQG